MAKLRFYIDTNDTIKLNAYVEQCFKVQVTCNLKTLLEKILLLQIIEITKLYPPNKGFSLLADSMHVIVDLRSRFH